MSAITRDEFLRGVAALNAYRKLVREVGDAMHRAGVGYRIEDLGGAPLAEELTRQLEARCNDPSEGDGSMIEYMLYDCGGPVREADGTEFMVNTPERLWTYWEATHNGPFAHVKHKAEGDCEPQPKDTK